MKKILLVDDSALMRRVLCDIITSEGSFSIEDEATNGLDALELLKKKSYDAVVLDVNMPKMDGLTLLKNIKAAGIRTRILMASTLTEKGSQVTLDALELGALDFIHKPEWSYKCRDNQFKEELLYTLNAVCNSSLPNLEIKHTEISNVTKISEYVRKNSGKISGNRVVAIAVSTGGPKSLQSIIPVLPKDLAAPVVVVQHMPEGFTASLASRLDSASSIKVVEGQEGDILQSGCVYIAKAGSHLNLVKNGKLTKIHYTNEPHREGVRPCANYMYESLADSEYDEAVCVVMTGMGADGTEGIKHLKEAGKKTFVITQEGNSCVVNGMPAACVKAGLSDLSVTLTQIAQEIILRVGVKSDGR